MTVAESQKPFGKWTWLVSSWFTWSELSYKYFGWFAAVLAGEYFPKILSETKCADFKRKKKLLIMSLSLTVSDSEPQHSLSICVFKREHDQDAAILPNTHEEQEMNPNSMSDRCCLRWQSSSTCTSAKITFAEKLPPFLTSSGFYFWLFTTFVYVYGNTK